ncbi:hypothetical protein FDZ71_02140, partial [bacterium]
MTKRFTKRGTALQIYLNEKNCEIKEGLSAGEVRDLRKPGADIIVINGFPASPETRLAKGDRLVL